MKQHTWTALLLALFLLAPMRVLAQEAEIPVHTEPAKTVMLPAEEPGKRSLEPESLILSEETPKPPEQPENPIEEPTGPSPLPDPAPSGVFQLGGFDGPQTIPGEPVPLAESWESQVYETVLEGWRQLKPEVDVRALDITAANWDSFWDVLRAVINDHPELFYANWYSSTNRWNNGQLMTLELQYHSFPIALEEAIQKFEDEVEEAMTQVKGVTDETEIALILHDWLALRCHYNREASQALWQGTWTEFYQTTDHIYMWNAYGALVSRDPVCQGYALAYRYLLSLRGIDALYLSSQEMNHGWNAVKIDGQWYHIDVTWDDPSPDTEGACRHTYFLLSDETISDDAHKHNGWTELVECTSSRFEEGWAFNGIDLPLYYRDDGFYYLETVEEVIQPDEFNPVTANLSAVFRTEALDTPGIRLPNSLGRALPGGVVWLEDRLYLCPYAYSDETERLLLVYDLDSGVLAQAGRFSHTPAPSADGHYVAGYDRQPGLRYNSQTGKVEAVSINNYHVIASFPTPSLSASWAGQNTEAIAPELSPDGGAAILISTPPETSLWAAFYNEGRLVALRKTYAQEKFASAFQISPPVALAYLDMDRLPKYDAVRLMLLSEDFLPLCPAEPNNTTGDESGGETGGGVNLPEDITEDNADLFLFMTAGTLEKS